jgi:hypothetical protein
VTAAGAEGFDELGVAAAPADGVRHCVDWSEQRHHVAGHLGARLADRLFELGWIERQPSGRAVTITEAGGPALADRLGLDLAAL